MAVGPALILFGRLLSQFGGCDVVVGGRHDPPTEYVRLVILYRGGNREEAIRRFRHLGRAEVDAMNLRIKQVLEMVETGALEPYGPDDDCLKATSLLETELAMELAEDSQWDDADSHFDKVWVLSRLIGSPRIQARFQRNWLLAVGLFFHELIFVGTPDDAFWRGDRFLHQAVNRYPRDPEILLAAGALLEWSGSLRWGDPSHLKEAEELYARALQLAPDDRETLLRHGWVLKKLGREAEAASPLLRVLELGAEDGLIYRSRMVLGSLAEESGRLSDAIAHYEEASKLVPSWQVAYVALGHALHSSGSHERARKILDEALAMRASDEALLGWWSYELGLAVRFDSLFESMRAEVVP